MKYNFDKVVDGAVDSVGEPYDYGSIMHYPFNAFSKDWNKDTIVPRRPLNGKKPYVELSDSDARQANIMYKCSGWYNVTFTSSKMFNYSYHHYYITTRTPPN